MKTPHRGTTCLDRCANFLYRFYAYKSIRYGLAPILMGVPPGVITAFYGNDFLRTWITSNYPNAAANLASHVIPYTILSMIYPSAILALATGVLQRVHAKSLTANWLHHLNVALDRVVGCKERRFEEHASNCESLTRETAFCAITKPDLQIQELIQGICQFFNAIRPQDDQERLITVMLCDIEDGKIVKIPIYFPQDETKPSARDIELLNSAQSGIQTAIRTRDIVVVQSTSQEMLKPAAERRFIELTNGQGTIGSLICYPITRDGDVPLVISIHCDEDGFFKEAKEELYKCSIARFALRLRLEYSLLLLKEALCE